MAKVPDQRYQTPAEVAQVLEPFSAGNLMPAAIPVDPPPVAPVPAEAHKTTVSVFHFGETEISHVVTPKSQKSSTMPPADPWTWVWIAGAAAGAFLIILLLLRLILR